MIKECVVLDGKVINIGPWDYQYTEVDGQQVAQNTLPDGATIENRDFEYDADRGWYETGTPATPTAEEEIAQLKQAVAELSILIATPTA